MRTYLLLVVPIIAVWGMSFQAFDLYRPRRMGTRLSEFLDVAKANTLSVLILVALTFFLRQYEYSRLVLLYFWLLNLITLGFSRVLFRKRCGSFAARATISVTRSLSARADWGGAWWRRSPNIQSWV